MKRKPSMNTTVTEKRGKTVPGGEIARELNRSSLSEVSKKKGGKIPEVSFCDIEMKNWVDEYIKATSDKKMAESDMKEYGEFIRPKMEEERLKYCRDNNIYVRSLNFEGRITFAMPRLSVIAPSIGETIEGKQLLAVALFGIELAKKYFKVETVLRVKESVSKSLDEIHRLERLCSGRGTEEDFSSNRFAEMFEYCSELVLVSRNNEYGEEVICLEEDLSMDIHIFKLVENAINNKLLSFNSGTIRVNEKDLISSTR